ncbi:MAG: alpha/beta hydrolase [Lachnospiraceae bacterium]|nr:alpha/beta hydrolase [Lachnospiraceae bacterium]
MKTEIIHVNNQGKGISEALTEVEFAANRSGMGDRAARRLRLVAEEMLEMVRNITGEFEADFSAAIDDVKCELKLWADTAKFLGMDQSEDFTAESQAAAWHTEGVTGKLRGMMQSGFSNLRENEEELAEIGIRRADDAILKELGRPESEEAYVWTLESYGLSAFDALTLDNDESWAELGHSIIASLADDIRVYVFKDSIELTVIKNIREEKAAEGYAIAPEFDALRKVPVPKSRFQVRIVQVMYKHLEWKAPVNKGVRVDKSRIPSESSSEGSLHTLIYSSSKLSENEVAPCVLLLHGGAFLFPAMPYHYRLANIIAREVGCRVIMPMYELAPDFVPPIQQEEVFEVYCHILNHPTWYHIDPKRIAVIGDSAGGTLAAALSLMTRDRGVQMPVGQALCYPSLDARLTSDSMKRYRDVPVCNGDSIRAYYKLCRSDEYQGKEDYRSPVEAASLRDLPDAYVETAEFDALHDDGIAYAKRLKREGNRVILNETKGTVHAFDMAEKSSILRDAMDKRIAFLRQVLNMN